MKSLLEFKKYAPVLFTFLFLAALFGSCFFDTRKQDKAEKESLRYDQSLAQLAVLSSQYSRRTNCSFSSPLLGETKIPASNSDGYRCINRTVKTSFISNFDTGQAIAVNIQYINPLSKLLCKCKDSQSPLTGENTWYKRNPLYQDMADPFFTHKYQKDSNGNITGVDAFVPTITGDTLLCYPTCDPKIEAYQEIIIQ